MRRWLVTSLATATLVLAVQPTASAAPEDWVGSAITSPSAATTSSPAITAKFVRAYDANHRLLATTTVASPAGLPAGCTATVGGTTVVRGADNVHNTSATLTTSCNGTYAISVRAILEGRSCDFLGCGGYTVRDTHTLTGSLTVRAPAPAVTGTTAVAGADRSVAVAWTPVADAPPDFLGYRVERVSASGIAVTLATIDDRTASSFTDTSPPAEGGETTYRVYGRRSAPGGEVESAPAVTTADVPADPDAPADPDPPGDPGAPGEPPSAGGSGTSGRVSGGVTTSRRPAGTVRVPRTGSPSRSFFPPLLSRPDAEDTGFDEELPFEDREPGSAEAILPQDQLGAGPLDASPGRGLVVPAATGLVLAVWALHLRFLVRAAKPEYLDDRDLPELAQW